MGHPICPADAENGGDPRSEEHEVGEVRVKPGAEGGKQRTDERNPDQPRLKGPRRLAVSRDVPTSPNRAIVHHLPP